MKRRYLMFFFLAVFSALSFISTASARGGVFVIEPMQEVTEIVELTVSDKSSADVSGNVSVIDGLIDFYVTSPSGNVLLRYNKTAFTRFKFDAVESGAYILHLANTWSENNVTATLDYGVNYEITLDAQMNMLASVKGGKISIVPPPPDFINPIEILKILGLTISTIFAFAKLGDKALRFFRWVYWRLKHGKSKTPVVISPSVKTST